ncbi:hypothetical protein RJT34_01206 [Clitoria ternatea]|uniref:RING-type E3 ubiquitin transferase n=1 Tax=Clitoria ternatea TaxID=43366 RepID=A0AAN9Q155_CLITE
MATEIVISLILLFVGIAVLVVIHVCIVGRAFGRNNNNNNGHGAGGTQEHSGMKRGFGGENIGDLKNLPCFDYEGAKKRCSLVDCAVCLENFKVGDKCRLLPNCSHTFHVHCIDSWILKTPICPICRTWIHSRVVVPSLSHNVELEVEMA